MTDKVSIIIPVYNTNEEYLDECFKSINNQTYKNIEVIVVDDGSKEKTATYLDKYTKNYNYKIFHKKNEGVSVARNFGIEKATGDWLMFVDSDDFLDEKALETLINNSKSMDIVIGGVKRTTINNVLNVESHIFEGEESDELIRSVFQAKSAKYPYVDGLWGKIYRKDFWTSNNLELQKDLKYGEDATLNIEAYIKARRINFFSDILYYWRTNDESVTAKYNVKLMDEQEKVLNKMKEKFPEITGKIYKKEFISYISRTLKNVIENMYLSAETTKKEKRELLNKLISKPIYKDCINSNLYNEVPIKRKIILILLKFKMFWAIEVLFKIYRKCK